MFAYGYFSLNFLLYTCKNSGNMSSIMLLNSKSVSYIVLELLVL